jgi:DNA-binding MarR family transcriptional regulator
VALNIRTAQKTTRKAALPERPLVGAVLDELSSWNPREFITAFQRWHQGSISLIHLNVLTMLEANGPMSMSAIAEALDISVASATGVIDRMEARGLVKRRRHAEDRRVVLVEPAAGGRKVFGDIDNRRRKGLAVLLARLSDEELTSLLIGHRALRAARLAVAVQSGSGSGAEAMLRAAAVRAARAARAGS